METLFHYTTAQGLLGIVETSSLWASDHRFLNDAQEAVFARDLLIDALRSTENPVRHAGHWANHFGEPAIAAFAEYQHLIPEQLQSLQVGVYVACFCESGDLLSQWRGYGSDHGYSIELRFSALSESLSRLGTYGPATGLKKVSYGIEAASETVDAALQSVADFNLNHPGVKAYHAALELNSMLAGVKHPGFAEEQEWRLVAAFQLGSAVTRFRSTPMAIVPYIEVKLPSDCIASIRVGPGKNVDLREAGVRRLLKAVGSNAEVFRSTVPLRT